VRFGKSISLGNPVLSTWVYVRHFTLGKICPDYSPSILYSSEDYVGVIYATPNQPSTRAGAVLQAFKLPLPFPPLHTFHLSKPASPQHDLQRPL
jgi:hypothetical protein